MFIHITLSLSLYIYIYIHICIYPGFGLSDSYPLGQTRKLAEWPADVLAVLDAEGIYVIIYIYIYIYYDI